MASPSIFMELAVSVAVVLMAGAVSYAAIKRVAKSPSTHEKKKAAVAKQPPSNCPIIN